MAIADTPPRWFFFFFFYQLRSLGYSLGKRPQDPANCSRLDHWSGVCLGSHVVESLRQGVDSSPARGVHSRGQLPVLVLGTTPGAQRGLSIPGSWLVGPLLLPSRQVSRSTLCYQLDSLAGRGPGHAILTRSVSLPAPPWEPLSVVLEFWVWLPPGTEGSWSSRSFPGQV